MTVRPKRRRGGRQRVCAQCGESFMAAQEHSSFTRKYCSSRCNGLAAQARAAASYPPREEVERAYREEGLSDRAFGRRHRRSYNWAVKVRVHYGIRALTLQEAKALREQREGGPRTRLHSHGYILVSTNRGQEYQHRLVMEQRLGRRLTPGEEVHHRDGNPANNDPDNLVLYSNHSEHMRDERRVAPGRRSRSKRSWKTARAKVDGEGRCRYCGRSETKLDAAHLVPRALVAPGAEKGEHPDNIVPLCGGLCHPAFDAGTLDLLPFLTISEQGKAIELHPNGLLGALRRVTGKRWEPAA